MKTMKKLKSIFSFILSIAILVFSIFLAGVVLKFIFQVFLLGWGLW